MKLSAALVAFAIACTPPVAPEPDPTGCREACDQLRYFSCEEGVPTQAGLTCEALCRRVQSGGVGAPLNVRCVALSQTMTEIHACGVRCL